MLRPASPTRWVRSAAALPTPARLRTYTAGLAAVAVLLTLLAAAGPPVDRPALPWWLLALAFAATHAVGAGRLRALPLTSVPLAVGLFLTPGPGVVVAAALGVSVAGGARRTPRGPLATATASTALSTAAAVAVFAAVAPGSDALRPLGWLAAVLAAVTAEVVTSAFGLGHAMVGGHRPAWPYLLRGLAPRLATAGAGGVLGVLAATALHADGRTAWLLVAAAAVGLLTVQRHARAVERHDRLRRLYDYVRRLTAIRPAGHDLPSTLADLRVLLPAEHVELALLAAPDETPIREAAGGPAGTEGLDAFERQVLETGEPALEPRSRTAPDRMAVRVAAGDRVGVLRADRRAGTDRGFDAADLETLDAVGAALGAALEKGLLIEGLQQAATLDRVTGLANLDSTRLALTAMLADGPRRAVVLLLDLDRFQDVNDTLGHDAGDRVLREVAQRLEAAAPGGATVGRVGGDQFAVLWRGSADGDVAHLAGLGLRAQVEGTVRIGTLSADVRMTVGLARAPEHGTDAGTLLRRAEMAMYAAKGSGSRFYEWEPGLERDGTRRLSIVRGLREALSADDLTVVFQPKVRLDSGHVEGLEALARWDDAALGVVGPDEFIPLAETSGLIGTLTTTVLRQALEAVRRWHDLGVEVGVAVNLSARSLLDPRLVRQTAVLLETHGVAPQWLTFEITETEVMDHPERSVDVLRQLRALGVRLSIDDFGTGYSSLTYVKGLPVHEVKIDKTFVPDIAEDGADRAVVRAVVDLGHSLGLQVVAEGVETGTQSDLLQTLGVDSVQGYHHGRPMTAHDATAWLLGRTPSGV